MIIITGPYLKCSICRSTTHDDIINNNNNNTQFMGYNNNTYISIKNCIEYDDVKDSLSSRRPWERLHRVIIQRYNDAAIKIQSLFRSYMERIKVIIIIRYS